MMVGFLADECFSGFLTRSMRTAGFDVLRVGDVAPAASDEQVLGLAATEDRVLLTEDNDFGDLVVRLRLPTRGVVRVVLKSLNKPDQAARLIKALNELGDIEQASECGTDDFVSKPVNKFELLTRVKSLLRVRHLKNELERALTYLNEIEHDEEAQ